MRILILGGTAWLGRVIAETAVRAGHETTCLARGSAMPDGVSVVRVDRNRDDALAAVADGRWDAVIDLASEPGHVRRAVRDLEPVARRFVLISTGNVYASQAEQGADEDAPLLEPLVADTMSSMDDYGAAKVACEGAVLGSFGPERSAIVRPGLIGGPDDPSGRTGYWALRFARPSNPEGRVLVPDAPALPTAMIDVRDLADWTVRLAAGDAAGSFNAVGDPIPLPDHLAVARSVAGHAGPLVPAAEDWLQAHGVAEWSGQRSMPLWLADRSWYGMSARSNARALSAGLRLRPLAETLADALAADLRCDAVAGARAGLTDEDERELLEALDARRSDAGPLKAG